MILQYKGIEVFFTDQGKGSVVVLLHGFLEDSSMWKALVPKLQKKNRVICIDLLGHGKTGSLGYVHTMNTMASVVKAILNSLKLKKYIFIGHSMGGYVALAFAKLYIKNIKGLCLLNSTFKADTLELKQLRTRANKMVQTNFENMVRMSFANLFSAESKITHKEKYESALNIALNTSLQGYMAGQEGMKLREDSSLFFAKATFNKLIILGKKDTVINVKNTVLFAQKHDIGTHVLSNGHMSHIENKEDYIKHVMCFIKNT